MKGKMAKEPKVMKGKCRFTGRGIVIVYDREKGDDYCSVGNVCDRIECKYKSGTMNPFEK